MDIKHIQKQFKGLNPKYIYNWPLLPKAITLLGMTLATIIVGTSLLVYPEYDNLSDQQKKEEKLKKEFIDKAKIVVNLPLYEGQIKEVDKLFGSLLKQLPNKSEVASLLVDINKAALSRGLDIELFKPTSEVLKDFYAEYPISIKVTGNYGDIGAFAGDLSLLPRIVNLTDANISVNKEGKIVLEAIAKTYRYLEVEEQEAIKKEKEAKKKKEPKKTSANKE